MKKRKFSDGGDIGRFDEDTYARARKFVEDQERRAGQGMALDEEEPEPPKPKAAPKPAAPKPAASKPAAPPNAPAKTVAKEPEPPKPKPTPEEPVRYPTAGERFAQIRKQIADAEAENVRKRNERTVAGKKSLDNFMSGLKRRFGTQAMREEAGYAKGGSASSRADGCAKRGKTKGKMY